MDYKFNNIKDQIYNKFIKGEYGVPTIPSENEVIKKINQLTTLENIPLTSTSKMKDIDFSVISGKLSSIIDDIDILFESIEDESQDVLDQLTSSLQEHNGIKREIKRIKSQADDIVNGKLGEEYLQYNFTESFDDLSNIDVLRSDPIDTDAGLFTVGENSSVLVNMNHYINRKITFNVIDNLSPIIEQGFVGDANAENILSKNNPKSIQFRVQTLRPTRLIIITSLQLRADGKPVNINSVGISLDSGVSKGSIRLYYQNGYVWKNTPGQSIQEIKGDTVLFGFDAVDATHIKFEFIKDFPDVATTNEYFVNVYEVAIGKSSTRANATLYSKPIILTEYDSEQPILSNLSCVVDADVPSTCNLKVSVAQDRIISGSFINSAGLPVYANSVDAIDFISYPQITGFVYLSDILEKQTLSGLIPYRGMDLDWKEIKSSQSFGDSIPEILDFNFTSKKAPILNSLFTTTSVIKYGDRFYTGPWPQAGITDVYVSGWCNSANPAWDPYLSGLVYSGFIASGIDLQNLTPGNSWDEIAIGNGKTISDAGYESGIYSGILNSSDYSGQWLGYGSGYAYDFLNNDLGRVIRYNDYSNSTKGWWRPSSHSVTPTGINTQYAISGYLSPDQTSIDFGEFYFNGLQFYKIYKFNNLETVLDSTIRLYQFEERPISLDTDEYNHLFRWTYKSSTVDEIKTLTNQIDSVNASAPNFSGYSITFPTLNPNEEYSNFEVLEVRQYNTNFVLSPEKDYKAIRFEDTSVLSGVLLTGLNDNHPSMSPTGMSFNVKYNYKVKNKYLSTWISYAIVSPGIKDNIVISNRDIDGFPGSKIIKSIDLLNIDTDVTTTISSDTFILPFDTTNAKTNSHFKITMYCAANENTGFSANAAGDSEPYIPKETTDNIVVPGGIKLVTKLTSLKICDLGTLLYDTPLANDRKCALITDYNNEKFLVVKKPSKDSFSGYIFNSIQKSYSVKTDAQINNKGHYIRNGFDSNENVITYTTGSSGTNVINTLNDNDNTWNAGQTYSNYSNTYNTIHYPLHTSYGHKLNLEDTQTISVQNTLLGDGDVDPRAEDLESSKVGSTAWSAWIQAYYQDEYDTYSASSKYTITTGTVTNRGYLFYNTAENLPSFYSISYSTMNGTYNDIAKRFLYKIELESDGSLQIAPKVRSIRFEVNKGI